MVKCTILPCSLNTKIKNSLFSMLYAKCYFQRGRVESEEKDVEWEGKKKSWKHCIFFFLNDGMVSLQIVPLKLGYCSFPHRLSSIRRSKKKSQRMKTKLLTI